MNIPVILYGILVFLNVLLAGMFFATGGTLLTVIAVILVATVFATLKQKAWGIAFLVYFGWRLLLIPSRAAIVLYVVMIGLLGVTTTKQLKEPVSKFFTNNQKRTNIILTLLFFIAIITQFVNLNIPPNIHIETELTQTPEGYILKNTITDNENNPLIPENGLTWVLYKNNEAISSGFIKKEELTTNTITIQTQPHQSHIIKLIVLDTNQREYTKEIQPKTF